MIEFANRSEHQVVHRVQPQPVVHPVDGVLREVLVHRRVQLLGAGQVGAERLLDHDPVALGAAGRGDALGDAAEQRRRHLKVEQHALAVADGIRHGLVGPGIIQVAVDVAQQAQHLGRRRAVGIHLVERERVPRVVAELVQTPAALGHADDRDVQHPALDQPDQRRKGLQLGQVAGSAEDHQRVNLLLWCCHIASPIRSAHGLIRACPRPRRATRHG